MWNKTKQRWQEPISDHKAIVIDTLRELADERLQRERWLSASGPEVSSFTEAHCQLFDDTGLGDALDKGLSVFGEPIDGQFRRLGEMMRQVDSSLRPDALIEDNSMQLIRHATSEILRELQGRGGAGTVAGTD